MKYASLLTNVTAAAVAVAGYLLPGAAGAVLKATGLFAFSGAVTNWLAIHMLFEKIPGLYGSGVIPARFEEFKGSIKQMMLKEFFDHQHIERFFSAAGASGASIAEKVDYDALFDKLVTAIAESPLGGMLSFVGGVQALQPMREPVKLKLQDMVKELAENQLQGGGSLAGGLRDKVEAMIDHRLAELTPDQVKRLVQEIIAEHLGWLVIWGGVFGGVIGLGSSLMHLAM